MLQLVIVLKGLAEFAILLVLAQGLVYALSFGRHEVNPVYRGIRFLTSPVNGLVRRITPGVILDKHVPAVSLLLLFFCWVGLLVAKVQLMPIGAAAGG